MHKCDTKTKKRSPFYNSCASLRMSNYCDSRSLTGIVWLLFPCWWLMTSNSSARLSLNVSTITISVCGVTPTPIVQADKACGAGLRKRLSFSATHTKHKASLDMLPYVSKQLPYRRWISTQQHLNEITKNKQGKAVQLIFEMKERKPIINSTTEQFWSRTWLTLNKYN